MAEECPERLAKMIVHSLRLARTSRSIRKPAQTQDDLASTVKGKGDLDDDDVAWLKDFKRFETKVFEGGG